MANKFIPLANPTSSKTPQEIIEEMKKDKNIIKLAKISKVEEKNKKNKNSVPTERAKRVKKLIPIYNKFDDKCIKPLEKISSKRGIDFLVSLTKISQDTMDIFFGNGGKVNYFKEPYNHINDIFNSENMLKLSKIARKYKFNNFTAFTDCYLNNDFDFKNGSAKTDDMMKQIFTTIQNSNSILNWATNKQIFRFDNDFTEEIINSDNLVITKDMFDYLPFSTIYIDLETNIKMRDLFDKWLENSNDENKIDLAGFFFDYRKIIIENSEHYEMSFILIYREQSATQIRKILFCIENKEHSIDMVRGTNNADVNKFNVAVSLPYEIGCMVQLIAYLCTDKPEIQENEDFNANYKKPVPCLHKPTDFKKFDVGVRFGTAVREWKKQKAEMSDNETDTTVTGKPRASYRPHYRRGHWHSYWYKTENGKVKKPKWIAPVFVNQNKNAETDYIIHKVEK